MADDHGRRTLPLMAHRGRKSHKPSWPFIDSWGLYRRSIAADGNCLFRALSDQLYNTTRRHEEIRHRVVRYLRCNKGHFEPFVMANVEESLIRSQPTTRSTRSRTTSVDHDPFEVYLENMAKASTWGGDIEITAFCEAFDRDVLIHRPTDVEHPFTIIRNSKRAAGQSRDFLHISFGNETAFAHYESVRPRKIVLAASTSSTESVTETTTTTNTRPRRQAADKSQSLAERHPVPLGHVQKTHSSLTHEEMHQFLHECRTELDQTFQRMMEGDRERSSSTSSISRNSSTSKRSRDDVNEESDRAPKRAVRTISLRRKRRAAVPTVTPASTLDGTGASIPFDIDAVATSPLREHEAGERRNLVGGAPKNVYGGESATGDAPPRISRARMQAKNA